MDFLYFIDNNFTVRYLELNRNNAVISSLTCPTSFLTSQKLQSITAIQSSNEGNTDMFTVMKENAMFLLELSSTSSRKNHKKLRTFRFISIKIITFHLSKLKQC